MTFADGRFLTNIAFPLISITERETKQANRSAIQLAYLSNTDSG